MADHDEVRVVYGFFERNGNALCYRYGAERLRIEPWGENSLRVRAWKQAEPDPQDEFLRRTDAAELEQMVRSLREPYGRAAAMYVLDGMPVAAIAQALGRPAPTVQNQLFRAKMILRKQITERRQE